MAAPVPLPSLACRPRSWAVVFSPHLILCLGDLLDVGGFTDSMYFDIHQWLLVGLQTSRNYTKMSFWGKEA